MKCMRLFVLVLVVTLSISVAHAQQYLGCYRDQGDPSGTSGRDLSGFVVNEAGMTTNRCISECAARGFTFAGTQYSSWCFCGNTYGNSGPADNCNMACSGNANEVCGGAWANSVYRVGPAQPGVSSVRYVGCYRDQGDPTGVSGRDLSGFVFNDVRMTTNWCVTECAARRFTFAGTQYSSWCFCGNAYGNSGPAENCNMACSGNANEVCGGAWANSVYQITFAQPPVGPAGYLGCFRDQGDPTGTNGRDLSGFVLNDAGMTTNRCIAECRARGFAFAGTQYSSWCFCGNTYGNSGPADNCNMTCSGNANEICGGAWANSVYQVTQAPPQATPVDCAECARQKCAECQNAIILLCEVSEGPGVDAAACDACMRRQGCK